MVWIWVIIAIIVIAGLLFWVKSGKKDDEVNLSSDSEGPVIEETPEATETPEAPIEESVVETPVEEPAEAPVEAPAEPEVEVPTEEPQEEEASSDEDKTV